MRAVRLAAFSQQNLARMGLQQARVSFVSLASCERAASAAVTAGRFSAGGPRLLSQLSAVDPVNTTPITEDSRREEIEQFLRQNDIHVSDKMAPSPILRFEDSGLPKHLLNLVLSQFPAPTPIQAQAGAEPTNMNLHSILLATQILSKN